MYPNPTTYTLPLGEKIRVSSRRRFILVRDAADGSDAVFTVRRSDDLATLEREFRRDTDHIIDQAARTVTFYFNGRKETTNLIVKVRIPTDELNRVARGES
jgi:hypothetical protein